MTEKVNRREVMGAVAGLAAALGCAGGAMAAGLELKAEDKAHREWLAKIIKQTEPIKVGMTRKELEKVLVEDVGGLVRPQLMRYQHPACTYVKLDLEFDLAKSGNRKDDKIVKRSMPLLDLVANAARW